MVDPFFGGKIPTIAEMKLMEARGQLPKDVLAPRIQPRVDRPQELPKEQLEDSVGMWRGLS